MKSIVIVPTYNEAAGILAMLDAVLLRAPDTDVLVVDDNSPDGTARLVLGHPQYGHRLHLLSRAQKDGLGSAYRAGFEWALGGPYDVIAQMDADLSHPPERLPALFAALEHADVAVGSRYVRGGRVHDWPLRRRLVSRGGNLYVRIVLGLPVHDATAGFRAFRRAALQQIGVLDSESDGYCFQIENTWRACRLGLRVTEVPITFTDRTLGESKMTGDIVREAMLRVLTWRWRELTHPARAREVRTFLAVGGAGYVVDVMSFNLLRSAPVLSAMDPSYARVLAVALAMVVTYLGNRQYTWRGRSNGDRRREVALFMMFNVIGLALSVVALVVSHDLLGLTSRLDDNISANGLGLALGTLFRYWSYKRFVFTEARAGNDVAEAPGGDRLPHLTTT